MPPSYLLAVPQGITEELTGGGGDGGEGGGDIIGLHHPWALSFGLLRAQRIRHLICTRHGMRATHLLSQNEPGQHCSSLVHRVPSWLHWLPPQDCVQSLLMNVFCESAAKASAPALVLGSVCIAYRRHSGVASGARG